MKNELILMQRDGYSPHTIPFETSTRQHIETPRENTTSYIIESARRGADGLPIDPRAEVRVITEATYAREAQGSLIFDPANPQTIINNPRSVTACFVAGTLVHTDKGLVPIEKLRVGDKVLAQPEMKGEQAYKRVVNTFEFEDKDVYLLIFGTQDKVDQLVATGNHPFWVKDRGWLQLSDISPGEEFELPDGTFASAYCVKPIYQTEKADIG
jgi:Pretoxin HINT domain